MSAKNKILIKGNDSYAFSVSKKKNTASVDECNFNVEEDKNYQMTFDEASELYQRLLDKGFEEAF